MTASKKMLNMCLLDILRRRSDAHHRLSQQDLIAALDREYNLTCERKAIKANVDALIDFGHDIVYDNGYYLASRTFEDSELRLLIDSVLFSKHVPLKQCRALIDKLRGLQSDYFSVRTANILPLGDGQLENRQLFYTIDVLDEAIERKKQVSFTYNAYDTDKQLHPRRTAPYVVNPYQIVTANGRYYLVCNYDKYETIANYRIDRITDIKRLETPTKPLSQLQGYRAGLDLPKHLAEHIYMFSGPSVPVTFRIQRRAVGDVLDWFGASATFAHQTEDQCEVSVRVNEQAMLFWALQYGQHVEILAPQSLREKILATLEEMRTRYGA